MFSRLTPVVIALFAMAGAAAAQCTTGQLALCCLSPLVVGRSVLCWWSTPIHVWLGWVRGGLFPYPDSTV